MKKLIAITVAAALLLAMVVAAPVAAQTEWHVYPGPGTPIQAAVDAAAPGDTIIVHAGTYNETVTIRSDDYDLTLEGKGAVIEDTDGSLLYGIDLKGGAHHISISGFEIMDFYQKDDAGIAGWTNPWDADFQAMHHITIHHNYIHNNYDGINIGAFDWSAGSPPSWRHNNITIQHNLIEDNHYRGIDFWSVSDSTVAWNEILNNGGDWNGNGVFNEPADDMNANGVTDGDGMTWVYVSDSTATHNTINGSSEVGLSMNQSTGNVVIHNDVTNNPNLGIALFGWGAPTTANVFVHNDARGNTSWDILCYLKWGSQVFGNKWVKNKYDEASPDPPV